MITAADIEVVRQFVRREAAAGRIKFAPAMPSGRTPEQRRAYYLNRKQRLLAQGLTTEGKRRKYPHGNPSPHAVYMRQWRATKRNEKRNENDQRGSIPADPR